MSIEILAGIPTIRCDLFIAEETRDSYGCRVSVSADDSTVANWLWVPVVRCHVCPVCASTPISIDGILKLLRGKGPLPSFLAPFAGPCTHSHTMGAGAVKTPAGACPSEICTQCGVWRLVTTRYGVGTWRAAETLRDALEKGVRDG